MPVIDPNYRPDGYFGSGGPKPSGPLLFNGKPILPQSEYLPKPSYINKVAPPPEEIGLQTARPGGPEPYLFGRRLVRPTIISAASDSQDRLLLDLLVSVGEIEEYEGVYFGGTNEGLPAAWEFFTGTSGQSTSDLMRTAKGSYDSLSGKAHIVVRLNPGASLDIKVLTKGLKLYDPRSATTVYSTNPALALSRVLTDSGYTMDMDSVGDAADYCDETVGSEKRWELGLYIDQRQPLRLWAHALAQYAGCLIDIQGGSVFLVPDKPRSSTHTVTTSDILSGSFRLYKAGSRGVPKRVAIHYEDENSEEKIAETDTSADPGTTTRLRMPGFTTYGMARRYAIEVYNKSQNDLRLEFVGFDDGLSLSVGDVGEITHSAFGLSAKQMVLLDYRQVDRGRWFRSYAEYDPANYSDTLFTEPTYGDTDLPNPNEPPDGPTPTLTEELHTDGATISRFKIQFSGVSWPYIDGYRVVCDGEQNVLEIIIAHKGAGETHTVYTSALKPDVTYNCKVYVKSNTGVYSANPGTASKIALVSKLPPGDVPWANFFEAGSLVAGQWGRAEEIPGDLVGYTIKRIPEANHTGTAADWTNTNAVVITERLDAQSILTPQQPAGTFYYCIKAVDRYGNESVNALCKKVTITIDAWSTNLVELDVGDTTHMHVYVLDGDAKYATTSLKTGGVGESWASRFGDTSPQAVWSGSVTSSPAERWHGDQATDSEFNTEVWDSTADRGGNWFFQDENVTVFGGTRVNAISLSADTSPWSFSDTTGNTTSATARFMKAKVYTSDSPASAGDGLHIKLPIEASFSGAILPQSSTVTIAENSPLSNPVAVTFTTPYSTAPKVTLTVLGSTPKIAVADNVTTTGFDLYLFDLSGLKTSGQVTWDAKGT